MRAPAWSAGADVTLSDVPAASVNVALLETASVPIVAVPEYVGRKMKFPSSTTRPE